MESEITAHYGEVVQICVERNVSLTTATIDLRLENPSGQEVGVGAQSLIFVVGATEACFDFVVPEQTPLGSYAYWIDGVEAEPLKVVEEERSYGICGVFPSHQATGHDPSLYSYDRFGNSYDTEIDNSRFSQLTSAQADVGYFNIRYNPVTIGLSDDELDVICLVFHDLSDLILQRQPENACGEITELMTPNIELTTNIPDNPAVLGTGSAIYNPVGNCYGVSESRVFKKINGGQIFNPDEIDALLNINPEADWLDFDLYSVVYHEALHILGFSAGLSYPEVFDAIPNPTANESSNTFATRWDHILHTVTSDPNVAPLPVLNRTAESFCRKLETSTFPSVDIFISLVEDNCVNNELVLVAGQNTAPIAGISTGQFLNTESDLLNALSHLGGNCIGGNNIPYLMLPSFDVGEEREIQAEEITLLCELGYSVGDCTGCYVLPYWDGVYNRSANYDFYASCCAFDNILCIGETAIISFDQILCNDRIDGSADFDIVDFQIFTVANNIANFEINYDDRTISITGTALGDFTINYIVKGCDDLSIMTTLHLVIEPCIDCSELDPCDNLICTNNFDFENINDNQLTGIIPWFFGNFWISETGDNSLDLCEVEEDNYALRIGAYQDNLESIAFNLSEPVFPGCELNINFDAFGVSNSGTTILELEILGSSEPPCNAWDRAVNSSCEPTGCENYIYAPYCIGEPESIEVVIERGFSCPDNYPFENHTKTWVNIENEPINVLILSAHFISNNANGIIYLDNLVVTQNCTNAAFDVENNCPNVTFTPALTGDDFIHDWDFGDGSTSTEPNPIHTYSENGIYEVVHTVTDDCGNISTSTQTVVIECDICPTPKFEITPQISDCGQAIFDIDPLQPSDTYTIDYGEIAQPDDDLSHTYNEAGIYNVSVTLTNDCGETATETIEVEITFPDPPSANIITDNSDECGEVCFELANLSPANATIEWHINDPLPDGTEYTGTPVCHQFLADGNYTYEVTITETECGQMTTITGDVVVEIVNSRPGFTFTENCPTITITPEDLSRPYTWTLQTTVPQTQTTLAGESATFSHPETSGIYTLIYTYLDDCGNSETVTTEINLTDCNPVELDCPCTTSNSLLVNTETEVLLSTLIDNPNSGFTADNLDLSGRCLNIKGTLVFDVPYVIIGGEIIFEPNAGMRTEPNTWLVLESINENGGLHACSQLWTGLEIAPNSQLIVANCTFQDAKRAITASNDALIDMAEVTFENNYIGLYHIGSGFNSQAIEGCTFDGSDGLLPTSDTGIGSKSYAGIQLLISQPSTPIAITDCQFNELSVGVHGVGHLDLIMSNNNFENIKTNTTEGYGLYMLGITGSTLKHGGSENIGGSRYFNCDNGIVTIGDIDVTISDAKINCSRRGIEISHSRAGIDIQNNNIVMPNTGTGIKLIANELATSILIKKNTITISGIPENGIEAFSGGIYGIAVEETVNQFSSADDFDILNNTINISTSSLVGAGIYINAATDIRIAEQNRIICGTTHDVGILINGSENCKIVDNIIKGGGSATGIGLKVENTSGTIYGCNNFSQLKTGTEFVAGSAGGTQFIKNNFNTPMGNGLVYRDMLTINPQLWTENTWQGAAADYTGAAALNEIVTDLFSAVEAQRYLIQTSEPPYFPPSVALPNYGGSDQPWMLASILPYDPPRCEDVVKKGPTKQDEKIADGLSLEGLFIESRTWAAERISYATLKSVVLEDLELPQDVIDKLRAFENEAANGQIGAYYRLNKKLRAVCQMDDPTLYDDWKNTWIAKRTALDTWFIGHQSLNEQSTAAEWAAFEDLQVEIADYNDTLIRLWETIEQERADKIAIALTENASLVADILPQSNEKQINELLLTTVMAGKTIIEADEAATILSIATQCPLEGGIAVHRARSLYELVDPDYDFTTTCEGIQTLQTNTTNHNQEQSLPELNKKSRLAHHWKVYPNPVDEELIINNLNNAKGQLYLYNGIGKRVASLQIDQPHITISTRGLPAGLYYLHLSSEGENIENKKIIITH